MGVVWGLGQISDGTSDALGVLVKGERVGLVWGLGHISVRKSAALGFLVIAAPPIRGRGWGYCRG